MTFLLKIAIAAALLASLTACMVVPPQGTYVEPGVVMVVPARTYVTPYGHRHYDERWRRHW